MKAQQQLKYQVNHHVLNVEVYNFNNDDNYHLKIDISFYEKNNPHPELANTYFGHLNLINKEYTQTLRVYGFKLDVNGNDISTPNPFVPQEAKSWYKDGLPKKYHKIIHEIVDLYRNLLPAVVAQ
ncbi:MAG: hypothetical protein J6K48_03240 [Lachnospiraceae bacterium]|nr:hypothetical protein [Lachnospiraceae bacterium]